MRRRRSIVPAALALLPIDYGHGVDAYNETSLQGEKPMTRRNSAVESMVPGGSYTATIRAEYSNRPGMLGHVASVIGEAGGDISSIDLVEANRDHMVRDITVGAIDSRHARRIIAALRKVDGVTVRSASVRVFLAHLGGKIEVHNKVPVTTRRDLSTVYTPGVARVCNAIATEPEVAWTLTTKKNTVAIVTDGTAVLGLGDLGPMASLPVMEGKGDALQGVRRRRRLTALPQYQGPGGDHRDRKGRCAWIRRDQSRGHLRTALL